VALRGQAQGILGDLSIDKQQDYKSLVKTLEERFAPPNQTELYVLVHAKPQPDITPFHFLTIDLYESKHQSETYNLTMMMYHHRLQLLHGLCVDKPRVY
jgi:hypothetical protein